MGESAIDESQKSKYIICADKLDLKTVDAKLTTAFGNDSRYYKCKYIPFSMVDKLDKLKSKIKDHAKEGVGKNYPFVWLQTKYGKLPAYSTNRSFGILTENANKYEM